VGVVAAVTTSTELKISSNYNASVQASYAAQAGIEEARARFKGLSSDINYIGDTSSPPLESWSVYVGTSSSWVTDDDPDWDNNLLNTGVDSLQSDISYWAKIRHKREDDLLSAAELYTENGTGPNDIIYYGYATSTSTTAEQFTSDTDPVTASPVEIVTSYGSSGNGSGVIEVQAKKTPAPPIFGAIYGSDVDFGDVAVDKVTITGDDNGSCSPGSASVPCIAYVTKTIDGDVERTSDAGPSTLITELSLATMVDELESLKTVTLTGDKANYSVGSSSNYEVVYCDATSLHPDAELDITTDSTGGYGILLVKGNVEFGGKVNWRGLIIASGTIRFQGSASDDMSIYGAILGGNIDYVLGNVDIYYDSCKIDNAMSSFPYSAFMWKDKKLIN
jgi:hypothetical protein